MKLVLGLITIGPKRADLANSDPLLHLKLLDEEFLLGPQKTANIVEHLICLAKMRAHGH